MYTWKIDDCFLFFCTVIICTVYKAEGWCNNCTVIIFDTNNYKNNIIFIYGIKKSCHF